MSTNIFIGSSTESIAVAKKVQELLQNKDTLVELWNHYFDAPGQFVLDSLINSADKFDFAVFLYAPDDTGYIRENKFFVARDNVVFETGLFMKSLGRERTILIVP